MEYAELIIRGRVKSYFDWRIFHLSHTPKLKIFWKSI